MSDIFDKITYSVNDTECFECTSHKPDSFGYPRTTRDGFRRLSRWIHWKDTGQKPECVMHTCDNPKCINPKHLKSGTHKLNMEDMNSKGRNGMLGKTCTDATKELMSSKKKGENNPGTSLSNLDARYIKMWLQSGFKVKQIATTFKVNIGVIYNIKYGKSFKECV